jgi:hypothetical protein
VADDPAEFADHVVRLLKEPAEGRALGRAGRAFVEANYGWDRSLLNLDRLLAEAVGSGPAPPRPQRLAGSGGAVSAPSRRMTLS